MQHQNRMKSKNKCWLAILMIWPTLACGQGYETGNRWFRVAQAKVSSLYPGVQGSPIVRQSEVMVVVRRKVALTADSAWFSGRRGDVEILNSRRQPFSGTARRGDTLFFVTRVNIPTYDETMPPADRIPGSVEAPAPLGYKGELLFRWFRKGCARYLAIEKLQLGEDVYAP